MSAQRPLLILGILAIGVVSSGCKSLAIGAVADALSSGGDVYGRDDDPELVEAAVPFGLKTMETVLDQTPEHRGLLLALSSGFVQYGVAFVDQRADELEGTDFTEAERMRARAQKLYRRALSYALRSFEVESEGFEAALRADPPTALAEIEPSEVPLLYWTAAAWGLWIGHSKDNPDAIGDLPIVRHLAARALALDPEWNRGALHELMITLEASLPQGSLERAREHFAKAVELSGGTRAGPYVTLAESVSVKEQNAREFHALLTKAMAVDLDAEPSDRLANVIMQRRARRLKAASEDLFIEDIDDSEKTATSTGAVGL